jgi:hypothetical protein
MPGPGSMPCPKPEPKAKSKARAKRHEAAIIQQVRAQCVARDGDCRVWQKWTWLSDAWSCSGESEWAHMAGHRRFETRGQEAEIRHLTSGTVMLCTRHHQLYDSRLLDIEPIDSAKGADGVLRIKQGPVSVLSVPRRAE